ncbi:hypothetical protein AK812_SmicGene18882 [Symbiodinium microadriaticum]|uniref:Uncharacterized protein n=1 Tax=Symbiodinium microadriaticum TaxID=2951 RepID=A0A1Q9DTX7_SYMMI|nr:hypothetical protein AK812_SmicGene18882 [Symbiodinium microadriaticum]
MLQLSGIMGCSSSVSVMHDEVEHTGITRVIYTDRTGQEFVQHSAPFKEGVRRFHSMRISDADKGKGWVQLNKFLAAIEQNPRLLEKRMRPSQLPKHCSQAALLKVDKEVSEQSLADVSTDVSNFASSSSPGSFA